MSTKKFSFWDRETVAWQSHDISVWNQNLIGLIQKSSQQDWLRFPFFYKSPCYLSFKSGIVLKVARLIEDLGFKTWAFYQRSLKWSPINAVALPPTCKSHLSLFFFEIPLLNSIVLHRRQSLINQMKQLLALIQKNFLWWKDSNSSHRRRIFQKKREIF